MKTLDRGFELVEHIVEEGGPVSIREMMDLTGLNRSTVYRYLSVLVKRRYVQADPQNRGYSPGCRILELSGSILRSFNVRNIARPHLLALSNALSLTGHLAIRDNDQILYLDKVETQRSLPIISRIGSRAPLYCTSLGKVFLAFEEPTVVSELYSKLAFTRRTENTITDIDHLKRELDSVRKNGYAVDNEENELGVFCMACPVFGVAETICAAISVTGLKRQFVQHDQIADRLTEAAGAISSALGGSIEQGTKNASS